jgi:hypothetical protein
MSLAPAQFSEPLYERRQLGLSFGIFFVGAHQDGHVPHIDDFLPARGKWPRNSAAEQCYEPPPPHEPPADRRPYPITLPALTGRVVRDSKSGQPTSATGQKRHFGSVLTTFGLPPTPDMPLHPTN